MSTIITKIGELLRLKMPEQSTMVKMTEMGQQEHQSNDMAAMSGEMQQMTDMKQREHQSNDMAAMPGKMEMTEM